MVKYLSAEAVACIIGLGYVGLPLAEAFSRKLQVIGFDTDVKKIQQLQRLQSPTESSIPLSAPSLTALTADYPSPTNLTFTADPNDISKADFIIICVPTPVTESKEPDLSHIRSVATIVSQSMKKGCVVILESTVYPGVTEEVVKPILEKGSGLRCGEQFKIAYSPERINPGDKEHTIDRTTKVVAGIDRETTELVAQLYQKVTPHIFKAKDIKTAEAAKVIENIQRDLNIALMNELAIIFEKINLSVKEVLNAAETKWNFHRYSPGLVGGHCIPVDPYYLVYKARELGYYPQVILAGRAINDYMAKHIAEISIKALSEAGKVIKGSRVLIMGLAYKEDIPDVRESPAKKVIKELEEYGVEVVAFDPLISANDLVEEFDTKALNLEEVKGIKVDCIIVTVAHSVFHRFSLTDLRKIQNDNPILIDVRGIFNPEEAKIAGLYYITL
ncbi:nucleotide sugar dehydrogenase [Chloroflexota bacterium]